MKLPVTLLRVVYWIGLVSTVVVFWISLRTTEDALNYTILAVILWAITYGIHRLIKIHHAEKDE